MLHTIGTKYRIAGFPDDEIFSLVETAKNTFALTKISDPGSLAAKPITLTGPLDKVRKPYGTGPAISDDLLRKLAGNKDWSLYVESKTILEEAQGLIFGAREKDYGSATKNFNDIATGWRVIVGARISAEQVGLMMAWLKICRANNSMQRDSLVDLAGYAGCIEKIQKGQ